MKAGLLALLCLGMVASLPAQDATTVYTTEYTTAQIDELVAPIALYPDPLIALILPASTAPSDIVLAARYLQSNGDPTQIDSQSWDDSVKALANYPDVLEWMNDNLEWTTALGRAFLQQPQQVMESIQQLRALARANGTLVNTPQQNVVLDGNNILIVPAASDVIYVPEYDPNVVFVDMPVVYTTPVIFFGPPCRVGPWLRFECDWDDFGVWFGVWHPGWAYVRDWRRTPNTVQTGRFWRPDNVHQRELLHALNRPVEAPPRPRPMARAPNLPQRPAQGFHPAATLPSSRPDPTGWRTDAGGHLARQPAPARPGGPRVISSSPGNVPSVPVVPNAPVINRVPQAPVINRVPSAPTLQNRPQPVPVTHPPAVPQNRPQSAPVNRPVATQQNRPSAPVNRPPPAVAPAAPPSGPLFGGYTRGTDARDFSNRGQVSRAAASPPPAPHPAPAPQSRPAPAPQARSAPPPQARVAPPPPSNGSNPNQRNQH